MDWYPGWVIGGLAGATLVLVTIWHWTARVRRGERREERDTRRDARRERPDER